MALGKSEKGTGRESFGFLIQLLARRLDAHMKTELEKQGVDIKVFSNLMMLFHKDGINQREIGKHLNFPEYYTSRNVDALVAAGFAERRADPDSRRSFLIFLTDAGRKKAALLPQVVRSSNDLFLDNLDAGERQELIRLLQKATEV
ncbi:MAG: MarR family winged helix-turn-helix transcriptional regulator [Paracoccaceae bacterium]